MKTRSFFYLLAFAFTLGAYAQKPHFKYIEVRTHYGGYFYSGEGLANTGVLDDGYGAIDVKFGWQPSREDHWAAMYGYPSYGVGVYTGFLGNSQIFGNPNAIFGFVNWKLSPREKKTQFSFEPAFGLTYNLNSFDPVNNPLNDAIGARMAVYFAIDFSWAYPISRELDFKYGLDFVHFSNGRTFAPNYGLNMLGINLGMKYNYSSKNNIEAYDDFYGTSENPVRFRRPESKAKEKLNENFISVYAAIGTNQNELDAGTSRRYGAFTGLLEYQHRFNTMSGISAGFDVMYDGSLIQNYSNPGDRYLYAMHAGYDFYFWKLVVRAQAGFYLSDRRGKGPYFLRPALQYNISKKFFTQVGLKTDGGADWIEFGIGFRPFKW